MSDREENRPEHVRVVEEGYDRMADSYLRTKDAADPLALAFLAGLARGLPPGAPVLDLGCGAGVPATRWLAERGFSVTGVDVSARQLELARGIVPSGTFVKADMGEVSFGTGSFAAVAALHSIIHLPRTQHPALLAKVHRWLCPGGRFLATWAIGSWEGEEEDWEGWGAPMRWSHHDAKTNLAMLRDAGFGVVSAEEHGHGKDGWLWVLARRPVARPTA